MYVYCLKRISRDIKVSLITKTNCKVQFFVKKKKLYDIDPIARKGYSDL